jgi:hypothetical protein
MATLLKLTTATTILSVDDNLNHLRLLATRLKPQEGTVLNFSKLMSFHKVRYDSTSNISHQYFSCR